MQEATVTLQFITPCLGNVRGGPGEPDKFEHDPVTGLVTFYQSYWQNLLVRGAQAYSKCQNGVRLIRVHPCIDGKPKIYRRYYGYDSHTDHEAFLVGDEIIVKALLPDGMTPLDFEAILKLAGGYFGISPYGWQSGFGRFTVKRST